MLVLPLLPLCTDAPSTQIPIGIPLTWDSRLRGREVESTLCVPARLLRGSVGRRLRPSQAAARRRGRVGRSGHPSRVARRGQWPRGSVGRAPRLAAERAQRVGRSGKCISLTRSPLTCQLNRFFYSSDTRSNGTSLGHPCVKETSLLSDDDPTSSGGTAGPGSTWVGRSGGPSRDGRQRRLRGGSVGWASRPEICFAALRAAGRSVGDTESETLATDFLSRSLETQSVLSSSRRLSVNLPLGFNV